MFIDKDGVKRKPKAYLAGFELFYPDGNERGAKMRELCDSYGVEGIFPPDPNPDPKMDYIPTDPNNRWQQANVHFSRDCNHMRRCDMIIANLNDFRSHQPDSGTAFECGMCFGLNKMMYGYVDDVRPMTERYRDGARGVAGSRVDENGFAFEECGFPLSYLLSKSMKIVEGDLETCLKVVRADLDCQMEEYEGKKGR